MSITPKLIHQSYKPTKEMKSWIRIFISSTLMAAGSTGSFLFIIEARGLDPFIERKEITGYCMYFFIQICFAPFSEQVHFT